MGLGFGFGFGIEWRGLVGLVTKSIIMREWIEDEGEENERKLVLGRKDRLINWSVILGKKY